MITGRINSGDNSELYILDDQRQKNVNLHSGQYLYLSVNESWIPVVISFSPNSRRWVFQNLEDLDVNGQKVMMKN